LEAPNARAESWATVGRGPVEPANNIDMQMMAIVNEISNRIWTTIG
jgi:hypothetical protein